MASFDLGSLTAKLEVQLGQFIQGLTQAKGVAQQTRTQLDKTLAAGVLSAARITAGVRPRTRGLTRPAHPPTLAPDLWWRTRP
jgi:hypothetical protein